MPTLNFSLPLVILLGIFGLGRGPERPDSGGNTNLETTRISAARKGKVNLKDNTGKLYIQIGDSVQPGQVLCTIKGHPENMQITARRKGKLSGIHVSDGKKVDYEDVLFSIESQPRSQKEIFNSALAEGGMQFTIPEGFQTAEVRNNPDMAYQWAIRLPAKRLEIRYSINPLKELLEEYKAAPKDRDRSRTDPNQIYTGLSLANINNTSIGDAQPLQLFPTDAVREEFNADWGGTTVYTPRNSFANFKKCLIVALHRDDRADAFICYLFDDYNYIEAEFMNSFHSLRFKE